ncbi:hypothetical protein [uncultured Corynebacterium sp.]|uniref:hypothetical protein n=1 Tax=uncultured Corynebacterium sp. TaxID=159447 RepID=UPI0025E82CC0|nr:hypothetical protein [uncultured Corynebacterium sp.]
MIDGGGSAPLEVTRTGPAAGWADVAAAERGGIRFVDVRASVVLVVVDGLLPPTRRDVELVEAVSGATGRCAVGLGVEGGEAGGEVSGAGRSDDARMLARRAAQWRDAVHVDVPVGPIDEDMARTLRLLAEGPARPITPTPGQRRRTWLGARLSAERAGRARGVEKQLRERRAAAPGVMADALEHVAGDARDLRAMTAQRLDREVDAAARRVGRELGLDGAPTSSAAPEPPPTGGWTEAGIGVLTLGAAVGAGGLLAGPLRWLGLPEWLVGALPVMAGIALATALVVGARRRRIDRERASWVAAHLAKVRRRWERDVAAAVQADSRPPPDGWRERQLVASLRAETGG